MSVGFKWGPLTVVRIFNDPKVGAIVEVGGKRDRIEIRVTPSGRLRAGPIIRRQITPYAAESLEVVE